jgi:hypothetical protein
MRSMGTHCIQVFGPTRHVAKKLPKVADQLTPCSAVYPRAILDVSDRDFVGINDFAK